MDYFTKFKKRVAPPKAPPTSAMQLSNFHKCWEYIHNMFGMEDRKHNMHVQQTEIPLKLRQMIDLLVDEEARLEDTSTGLCMEHFLKNNMLSYLVNSAEKEDYPVGIRGEIIRTVASMIDLLDDRFLVHNAVHKPTIKLLRSCVLDDRQSEIYSEDLVDLMYIICSKIHGFPALLNIFFHDMVWLNKFKSENQDTKKHEYEFLLFTYLLRFVHREGRSGDYARTGLLFLMEMANDQLGDFILGSDFSTIMAAGLGALYSQLPRKLIVQDEDDHIYSNPTSYLLSQDLADDLPNSQPSTGLGVEVSNSPVFKYQIDSFLKLLEFCQDVLNRCPNSEICSCLLNSVRTIFLANILYPTILECSDTDGSSVAVISYIDLILQTVQQGDLSKLIVGYLMDDESLDSKDALENLDTCTTHFTLKDLIFSRLKSTSQSTVIATLKLLKTLITKHCRYSVNLLSTYSDSTNNSISISHHYREVELYFSLMIAIDADNANKVLSLGYEEYLYDLETTISDDWCYQNMKPLDNQDSDLNAVNGRESPKLRRRRSFKYGQRLTDIKKLQEDEEDDVIPQINPIQQPILFDKPLTKHRVRPTDPLLQILLNLLSNFFTQSTELNIALTGVISSLALCPYRSLEGWISFSQSDRTNKDDILVLNTNGQPAVTRSKARRQDIYASLDTTTPVNDDEDDDEDDRSIDFGAERDSSKMTAPTFFKSYPPFFTLLCTLTQQVDYYRSEIENFDKLLEERRSALISGEVSFVEKRNISPSNSTTTSQSSSMGFFSIRSSIFRSTSNDSSTPILSPSSSASIDSSRIAPTSNTNMNTILSNPAAPLTLHIKKTSNTKVQPLFPSQFTSNTKGDPMLDLTNTFTSQNVEPSKLKQMDKSTEVSLSTILNNVVILEEAIKELVALIQVRCSLGIDEITYV